MKITRIQFGASAAALVVLLGLAGCHKQTEPASIKPALTKPVASIQDIMQAIVDPSADALWESVSSTTTAAGTEDKRPQSDKEWLQLRHLAINVAEAGNLLALEGRQVVHGSKALEDAHVSATLSAPEIQKRIGADHAAFAAFAQGLQAAAEQTIAAIDARNVDDFMKAGAQLDHACEACHMRYWYPNDNRPKQ